MQIKQECLCSFNHMEKNDITKALACSLSPGLIFSYYSQRRNKTEIHGEMDDSRAGSGEHLEVCESVQK